MSLPDSPHDSVSIHEEASRWVMRLDRGLTPAEQDDYLQWLAADPRRGQAVAKLGRAWESFDRLAGFQSAVEAVPDPDLLRPRRRASARWVFRVGLPLAAAAVVVLVSSLRQKSPADLDGAVPRVSAAITPPAPIEERTLDDGSVLRLNRGAVVTVDYTAAERRLRLARGEASFCVAKDPGRPFVVLAGGVAVRALGTEFNVHLGEHEVDVIVTEGTVAVASAPDSARATEELARTVAAGQRATMKLDTASAPIVTTLPPEELSRRLVWQPRLLTFNDEPLAVILGEFNRHNPVRLRLDDRSLEALRLSMRFRSDNVRGFLRLLESEFNVRVHGQPDGDIVLRARR